MNLRKERGHGLQATTPPRPGDEARGIATVALMAAALVALLHFATPLYVSALAYLWNAG